MQDPDVRAEHHDHRYGICDLEVRRKPWCYRYNCGYYVNFYSKTGRKMYGRWSKAEQSYRDEANGSARTQLRNSLSELRKVAFEDVEDWDIVNPRHRHSALWDVD